LADLWLTDARASWIHDISTGRLHDLGVSRACDGTHNHQHGAHKEHSS